MSLFAKATKPKGNGDSTLGILACIASIAGSRRRLSRKAMETTDFHPAYKDAILSFAKATKPKGNGDMPEA